LPNKEEGIAVAGGSMRIIQRELELERMNRVRGVVFSFILLVVGLVGCSHASPVIKEVKVQELNNDVKLFINNLENENGLYLYSSAGKTQYLVVKHSSVRQGEEATFLQSINAQIQDQILIINVEELSTNDYQDKRLEATRIYRLGSADEYGTIQIKKNGKEESFDSVGS
jgi:hypothetical protein